MNESQKPKFKFSHRYESPTNTLTGVKMMIPVLVFTQKNTDSEYHIVEPAFWAGYEGFRQFCKEWMVKQG